MVSISEHNALAALIELCREIFATDDIIPGDNFFMLGGTSLTIVELKDRLFAEYGFELEIEEFFRQDTLAGLASCCALPVSQEADG